MEKIHSQVEAGPRSKWFLRFLGGILVAGLALTSYGAFLLITGEPEAYLNENAGHFSRGLTQTFLAAGLIAIHLRRLRIAWAILALCFVALAWSVSLTLG